ncbi:hypothetical protein P7K49_031484 [Saguinus oedipus]|uniref:Uncharacterized protein n=1 Tax=Saguinus oedipus TaxID=9490 RepID=A0ABQ9TZI8_SAGOE|nr:hypothetical protein P7K49_031484 [Saguinus oedipus]
MKAGIHAAGEFTEQSAPRSGRGHSERGKQGRRALQEGRDGLSGSHTASAGMSVSRRSRAEDARGAPPAAPTRASPAQPPAPSHPRPRPPHKGDGRRAGRQEVAEPRRQPRPPPLSASPRALPPPAEESHRRGALTLLVTRVTRGGRYGAAPRGPPAPAAVAAELPAREEKRACVRARAECGRRGVRVCVLRPLGWLSQGSEAAAWNLERELSEREDRAGRRGEPPLTRAAPGPGETRPLLRLLGSRPLASLAPPASSARPQAAPRGHPEMGREGGGTDICPNQSAAGRLPPASPVSPPLDAPPLFV